MAIDSSLIVSIIALVVSTVVSAVIFYFGYTRSKKSEQVRISKEIWDDIASQYRRIKDLQHDAAVTENPRSINRDKLANTMESLMTDLGYFIFFVEKGEIKDPYILEYYGERLDGMFFYFRDFIMTYGLKDWEVSNRILWLILKYRMLAKKAKMLVVDSELHNSSIKWDDNMVSIGSHPESRKIYTRHEFEKGFETPITWDDMQGYPES